jgi:glycosyltransferase involved in cell wall biosynthesis
MSEPTISVVIPAYRAAHTICRAVDSVLAQSHPAHEIIVVDDGSPDELGAIVTRRYGPRIILCRKPNGGAASARNLGIDVSTGDIVSFLDADDYWEPYKLARQLQVFRQHNQVGVVGSAFFEQTPGRPRVAVRRDLPLDRVLKCDGPRAFHTGCQLWTGTVAVRRTVLSDHRFAPGLEPAEDRDLWIRLAAKAPVYMIAAPMATAVLEPGSLSRSNIDRDCSNMLRVVHRHQALLGERETRRWESDVYQHWAGVLMSEGVYGPAFRAAWRRFVREPLAPVGWWALTKSGVLSATRLRRTRNSAGM